MRLLGAVILMAALTVTVSAQVSTVTQPAVFERAYAVTGFDGLKPNSHGRLTLSANAVEFFSSRKSAKVPVSAIRCYNVGDDTRDAIPGLAGFLLEDVPFIGLINPLAEAGEMASGIGIGMFRKGTSALEFDYEDSRHGLHKAVFLLPRSSGDMVRHAMASLNIPAEVVAPASNPTFPKNANLLRNPIMPKRTGSIQVADPDAGSGGAPPFLEGVVYEQLISQLTSSKYFRHVLRAGEDIPADSGPMLSLRIQIAGFNGGKPRLRVATARFGKVKIAAEARVFDASAALLRDNIVDTSVGDDMSNVDASRMLASRVATLVTRKN
jgi:hypothetical protein